MPEMETPLPVCVNLNYGEYAQFEITAPSGQRILVDISNPAKLSGPVSANDILLTTHTHWDHWNEEFQVNFPGRQLFAQTGFLEAPGMVIQGIASAHNAGDRFKPEGGSNYIYLIDIGGIKIGHFGDIGQESLTEEQLAVLEKVDIAITQINNPYSEMNADNHKGFNLIEQVQPRLVIPTHLNLDTVKLAVSQWDGYYVDASSIEICQPDLTQDGTQFLLMGESAQTIRNYVDLMAWPATMDQE
jgi:L-ascorbate metabolism protein UlaG (beta-lactamase superfamily)